MPKYLKMLMSLVCLLAAAPLAAQDAAPVGPDKEVRALLDSLHPVSGDVDIAEAEAVLRLGTDYYFLPADEARRILVEAWGNPPESAVNVLGMVFPAGKTFLDDTWGAVITFEATGYVTDEDAASADYDALIAELQAGEEAANAERAKEGYPAVNLVGWAQQPTYDKATHSVIWAQNVRFEGSAENTLNYDVRLLGRRGVLSMNLVTTMAKLDETRVAANRFGSAAEFKAGARYADFQPGMDAEADYGVAGLVAAGMGAAAAKKLGLLGAILAFGKKFIVLILGAFAIAGNWVRKFFGRGGREEEAYELVPEEPAGSEPSLAIATGEPEGPGPAREGA